MHETVNIDYVEEFIKLTDEDCSKDVTWDDFFDHVGLPKGKRTDFLIGCIVKQAKERLENRESNSTALQ